MSAEQALVVVLLLAAFGAGWLARGAGSGGGPRSNSDSDGADPADEAADAFDEVLAAWLDRRNATAALRRFDAAAGAVRLAGDRPGLVARLEEADRAFDALRRGQPLDVATSRALEPVEDELHAARARSAA